MDWIQFFNDHNIEFVDVGPNVKRGNINCKCPWCGLDDPSEHLGINLEGKGFACWRNAKHRGKSPERLIRALLGVSFNQAHIMVKQYSQSDPDDSVLALLEGAPAHDKPNKKASGPLVMPSEFKYVEAHGSRRRFWKYLEQRGFDDVSQLKRDYNLRCCSIGPWKDRVIFPIYLNDDLVTWTGRVIQPTQNAARYLTLSENDGALFNIKDLLYNEDNLHGELLFVGEGPIDAIKMDFYGKEFGVRGTCLFGTEITETQIAVLGRLAKRFKRTILFLDPEAVETSFDLESVLNSYGIEIGKLLDGVEDPGAMTKVQTLKLIRSCGVDI